MYLFDRRYPDLVNLLLTSADLVLANASEKGIYHVFDLHTSHISAIMFRLIGVIIAVLFLT